MMKFTKLTCAMAFLGLVSGTAMAAGPIAINANGDLLVNLGDAPGNGRTRTLNFGNYGSEVSYAFTDENGVNTIGTIDGFNGENVEIVSGIGRDEIRLLGLTTDNLFIDTGRGRDTVDLNFVTVHNALDIDTRGGRDNVSFINVIVDGITTLRTRGGRDNVSITASQFEGAVRFLTGATAGDELYVSFSSFDGPVPIFNGGGGGDDTFIDGGTNYFALGGPSIRRFENIEQLVAVDPVPEPETTPDPEPTPEPTPDPEPLEVGDVGPGGGIVFQVNADGTAGLEVAPALAERAAYGCFGTQLVPFGSDLLVDTARRSVPGDAMRVVFENANENNICIADAAEATFAFSTDQADDWYLPSSDELISLLSALGPDQLARPGGGFWSSSEQTDENAFLILELVNGFDSSSANKTVLGNVLPVRSFGVN